MRRWNTWKEMWESRGADEPITTNFSSLAFYEERLLHRVYEEVSAMRIGWRNARMRNARNAA